MPTNRAIVIGAGIGGLATAALLAKAGWKVEVFEKQPRVGGRLQTWQSEGFTFDLRAAQPMLPEALEHYFSLLGERLEDHLDMQVLTPTRKLFFDYLQPVTLHGDTQEDIETLGKLEPAADKSLRSYTASANRTRKLAQKYFLYSNLSVQRTLTQTRLIPSAHWLANFLGISLHGFISRSFHTLPLQQILEHPAFMLGSSPYTTPAFNHFLSASDFYSEASYPMGGTQSLVNALKSIGAEAGVTYRFNAEVKHIFVNNGRATSVAVGGRRLPADLIVASGDLQHTEINLLPPGVRSYPRTYWEKSTPSPSALILCLGLKGRLPQLEHHNALLVREWRQNFEDIFQNKKWPKHASMYICKPSATDPSVAPSGHESLVVWIPLPAGVSASEASSEKAADEYLAQLEETAGLTDLRERLVVAKLYRPDEFGSEFYAWQNSLAGLSPSLKQRRPDSRSKIVRNLLYAGTDVQPLPGASGALISAEIAYKHLVGNTSTKTLPDIKLPKRTWRLQRTNTP